MLIKFISLFFIGSLFFIKDILPKNKQTKHSYNIVIGTVTLWFFTDHFIMIEEYKDLVLQLISLGLIFGFLLIANHKINKLNTVLKKTVIFTSLIVFTIISIELLMISFLGHPYFQLSILRTMLFTYIFFSLFIKWRSINKIVYNHRSSFQKYVIPYTVFISILFLSSLNYFNIPISNKYIWALTLYITASFPYLMFCTYVTYRYLIKVLVFTTLFVILSELILNIMIIVGFPEYKYPFSHGVVLLSAMLIPIFSVFFQYIDNYFDKLPPLTILNMKSMDKLFDLLKSVTSISELKNLIESNNIFISNKYRLEFWYIEKSQWKKLYKDTPTFNLNHIVFLQYQETIMLYNIEGEAQNFIDTPLKNEFYNLIEFMRKHSLLKVSLLQKSGEMVGIIGIVANNHRKTIFEYDLQKILTLENLMSNTLCNISYFKQLNQHKLMLEYINMAISKFNLNINEKISYSIIQNTILRIFPEMKLYFLLTYDRASQFFKPSSLIFDKEKNIQFKIFYGEIEKILNNNLYAKVSIEHDIVPNELVAIMKKLNICEAVFIRSNELNYESVYILFFNSSIDILDHRFSLCQVFLRQCDVFFQYQSNFSQLNKLRNYLKNLLDQLPIAIMITDPEFKLNYFNSKIDEEFEYSFSKHLNKQIINLPFQEKILGSIIDVMKKREDKFQQLEIAINNKLNLYLIHSFIVKNKEEKNDSIVSVLTNIQQSKELLQQMNQSNRLAMISKLAGGISHELNKPVLKLIKGVRQISDKWGDKSFQDSFNVNIIPQVDRINLLCQSLLRLSRSNTESLSEVYISDLLEQVIRLIGGDIKSSKQRLNIASIEKNKVIIDQVMVIQILMNLLIYCFKNISLQKSKVSLDIIVDKKNRLSIEIKVLNYNLKYLNKVKKIKDQLELSIVNQIVSNQSGSFNILREEQGIIFSIMLPIKEVKEVAA